MAYQFQDLRKDIVERYGVDGSIPEWVNSEWLTRRVNDRQREICDLVQELVQGTLPLSGTSGARTYALTKEFVEIQSVEWGTQGEITRKSRDQIAAIGGEKWRVATGHPAYWYQEDSHSIALYPKIVPGSAGTVYLYGTRYPADYTHATSPSELHTGLRRALVEGVWIDLARLDPDRARGQEREAAANTAYLNILTTYKHVRPVTPSFEAPRA